MTDALAGLRVALAARRQEIPSQFALGEVTGTDGGVQVKFDGETVTSGKAYRWLASYTPNVTDRVLLAQVGSTWVVLGKVT